MNRLGSIHPRANFKLERKEREKKKSVSQDQGRGIRIRTHLVAFTVY